MPDLRDAQATYAVVCAEHRTKPTNRSAAERALAEIVKLGACRLDHEIAAVHVA